MRHQVRRHFLLASSIAALSTAIGHAEPSKSVGALMEEVEVVAQKKALAENVQSVPIAISAFSAEKVEAMFAQDLKDVGLTAPNVSLTPLIPGVGNFLIRGMGTVGQSIPSSDPSVGVVVDGIPYGTIYGVLFDLFDIEAIEILRGPQGTLFGRNVTGGAVNVRTSRPTDTFEGKLKATLGSFDQHDLMGSVSGPLADEWAGKIAVLSKSHGDYWDKETGGGIGKSRSLVIRPAVSFEGDSMGFTGIFEHGRIDSDGLATHNFYLDGVEQSPYRNNKSTQASDGLNDFEWNSVVLEPTWDVGDGVLTLLYGYRNIEQDVHADIDGDPNNARFEFAKGTNLEQSQQSLEVRWAGDITDNVNLTTGIFLFEQDYEYRERRFVAKTLDRRGASKIDHWTYAGFAQADINLTGDLTMTLGGRYTKEEKEAWIGVIGDPTAVGDCATRVGPPFEDSTAMNDCRYAFHDKKKWGNFTPKVSLNWQVNDDIMGYLSYTKGFRSGGYNVRFTDLTLVTRPNAPLSTPGPYDEEVVDAYELGAKTEWLDRRLRVNVALFENKYDDLQRTSLNSSGGQEILNAASADIKGVEVDFVALLTDQLALEGSSGWIDAGYDKADFLRNTGRPASDFKLTMAPDRTSSLALTYDWPLPMGNITSRVSYTFVDSAMANDTNTAEMSQYELYDASVTFTDTTDTYKVALFGRNLKNEIYTNYISDTSSLGTKSMFLMPPRTYGVELTYNFY